MPPIPPMPEEYKKFKTGAPAGYTAIKGAPPTQVADAIRGMMNKAMGTQQKLTVENKEYLLQVEPHYNPPPKRPKGWHKAASAYIKK